MRERLLTAALSLFLTSSAFAGPALSDSSRRPGDDVIAAIQDGMILWLDTLLHWSGINDFKLVGFQMTPTDQPTVWRGGFIIREEGCGVDRMIDAAWQYVDNEDERAVETSMVVTRNCAGADRHVTLMIHQGLARVDGEAPAYAVESGRYTADEGQACDHETTVVHDADGRLTSLRIANACDGSDALFNCQDNWCAGPDLLTQIQITGPGEYTVRRVARTYVYHRRS
jgi:hypothetical protein